MFSVPDIVPVQPPTLSQISTLFPGVAWKNRRKLFDCVRMGMGELSLGELLLGEFAINDALSPLSRGCHRQEPPSLFHHHHYPVIIVIITQLCTILMEEKSNIFSWLSPRSVGVVEAELQWEQTWSNEEPILLIYYICKISISQTVSVCTFHLNNMFTGISNENEPPASAAHRSPFAGSSREIFIKLM